LNFSGLLSYINALPDFDDPRVFGMHPNTNRALMYVQANQLVDMLVTIEPQYRMMISLGYEFHFKFHLFQRIFVVLHRMVMLLVKLLLMILHQESHV
jgi:hypothetical protein